MALAIAAVILLGVGARPGDGSGLRAGSNSATFQDSAGEDSLAPDVTSVTVSNSDAGLLTFRVKIANRPKLTGRMNVRIELDTDLNPRNGCGASCDGVDMILDVIPGSVTVGRWRGSKWDFSGRSPSSLVHSYAGGTAAISVDAADLALTRFNFWILSDSNWTDSKSHVDYAPDQRRGTWSYHVKVTATAKCRPGQKSTAQKPCR
jgi:hypothetical protein